LGFVFLIFFFNGFSPGMPMVFLLQ
jgi:hypothetical protein